MEYDFLPVLELDAITGYIYNTNILEELLEKFNRIKLCMDTARLHTQFITEDSFDPMEIIKRFSKYTEEIHLSTVKITDKIEYVHYPAHPGLKPEEGWADIEAYLKAIFQLNPNVKVMFEHRSDLITDEELESCYSWVSGLFSK